MPDIDRKGRVQQEVLDGGCQRARLAKLPHLGEETLCFGAGRRHLPGLGLQDDNRPLLPRRTYPNQGTPVNRRVLVEDGLAADRVHRPGRGHHAMGHAAAEPEPPVLVQVARVAHPVPDAVAVRDLRQMLRLDARDIFPRDHRPADDQLADLARRQFDSPRRSNGSAHRRCG